MRSLILCVAAVFTVVPWAFAQSPYVGASVFGDIVRASGTSSVFAERSGNGEAIGFAVRVGTPLGDRWGVELEFARPSEIEESGQNVFPLQGVTQALPSGVTLLPPITFGARTSFRHTTISPGAWIRQDLAARSSLVYMVGLGFNRTEREFGYSFDPRILAAPTGLSILPFDSTFVSYGVRPFVGFEARLGLGEHAQLVPALRLHGVDDGWLLRPGVGLNWMF